MKLNLDMTFEEFTSELAIEWDKVKSQKLSDYFHSLVRAEQPLNQIYAYIAACGPRGVHRGAIEDKFTLSTESATKAIVALKRGGHIVRSEETGRRNGRWVATESLGHDLESTETALETSQTGSP